MQVARDLPQLERANAARVADLSFREALRLVAVNSATLKRFDAQEQPKLIDLAEANRKPKLAAVAERMRRDTQSIGDGKPVVVGKRSDQNHDHRQLDRLIAKLARRQPFKTNLKEVKQLERDIEALHAELEDLEARFDSGVQNLKALGIRRFSLWESLRQQARQELLED